MSAIELSGEQAEEIIVELQNAGAYEGEIKEDEDDNIALAIDFVEQAIDAYIDANMRGEEVIGVLSIANIEIDEETGKWGQNTDAQAAEEEYNEGEGKGEEVESDHTHTEDADKKTEALTFPIDNYDESKVSEVIEEFDSGNLTAADIDVVQNYEKKHKGRKTILNYEHQFDGEVEDALEEELDERLDAVEPEVKEEQKTKPDLTKLEQAHEEVELSKAKELKEHLPVPNELDGDLPEMPRDITDLTDDKLMQLRSEFGACFAYAYWQQALSTIDENAYKHLIDYQISREQQGIDTKVEGKKKTEAALERERKDAVYHEKVEHWRKKRSEAASEVIQYKALCKIYETYLDILSRQWSYRQSQLERG